MGVNTHAAVPNTADHDIVCYKAIYYSKDNNTWESKYRHQIFLYEPKPGDQFKMFNPGPLLSHKINNEFYRAGNGGVHTYMNMSAVFNSITRDWRFNDNRWKIILYKCVIPAGTLFFQSDDSEHKYVSDHALIVEKINKWPSYQVICTANTEQIACFNANDKKTIYKRAYKILKNRKNKKECGFQIRSRTKSQFISYSELQKYIQQ